MKELHIDIWHNIKWSNAHIIEVSNDKENEIEAEKVSEEITAKNFPNTMKNTDLQFQEAQRTPNKININGITKGTT